MTECQYPAPNEVEPGERSIAAPLVVNKLCVEFVNQDEEEIKRAIEHQTKRAIEHRVKI